jgi:putative lipoprotein
MMAMRALALAGVALFVFVAFTSHARAQQAAPDPDPWFGRDKALHFAASASIAVVAYGGTALATDDRPTRVVVSASVALGAGILKELWDLSGHGDASWRDLTWDVVGTTTGVLFAYGLDWAIARLRKRAPARDADKTPTGNRQWPADADRSMTAAHGS